jgi:hypothetical protein
MRKHLAALAAAATIAVATLAAPTAAEAQRWHGGFRGPGPFFGGLVAGALITGALAPHYYYRPAYYYRRPFYAYGYGYGYGPSCYRSYWNGWRWASYPVC